MTADRLRHRSVEARASPTSGLSGDRGSITLLSGAVLAALVVLAMGASDVARVLHAASRAQTAADAAALAAAQALANEEGPEPAALAGEYAERNGAVLETCTCKRGTFEATVSVRLPVGDLFLVAGGRTVQARARAQVDLPAP